jgi:dUTP pyrophosphatase
VNVRIYNASPYPLRYATDGASGLDLCAHISCERVVEVGRRWKFDTGITLAIPEGYEGQVRGRSGLRLHHGIVVPMGTIDSDYRSSIAVILFNLGEQPFTVRPGDRIGQLVIAPVTRITPVLVDSGADLGETVRGTGGFGSTGVR